MQKNYKYGDTKTINTIQYNNKSVYTASMPCITAKLHANVKNYGSVYIASTQH